MIEAFRTIMLYNVLNVKVGNNGLSFILLSFSFSSFYFGVSFSFSLFLDIDKEEDM